MPDQITLPTFTSPSCSPVSIQNIDPTECVGTSLTKINQNFANIKAMLGTQCSDINNVAGELEEASTIVYNAFNTLVIAPVGTIIMYKFRDGDGVYVNDSTVKSTDRTSIMSDINNGDKLILSNNPDGSQWQICNGNNTTPDLRGQFIISAGDTPTSQVFKENNYNGTGGKSEVTLTVGQMPTHNHSTNGNYGDSMIYYGTGEGLPKDEFNPDKPAFWTKANAGGLIIKNKGGGRAHENRPPYTVLLFAQRIS